MVTFFMLSRFRYFPFHLSSSSLSSSCVSRPPCRSSLLLLPHFRYINYSSQFTLFSLSLSCLVYLLSVHFRSLPFCLPSFIIIQIFFSFPSSLYCSSFFILFVFSFLTSFLFSPFAYFSALSLIRSTFSSLLSSYCLRLSSLPPYLACFLSLLC